METKEPRIPLDGTSRFRLTGRGFSTESAYRSKLGVAGRATRRTTSTSERTQWGRAHGLELDDGAYLSELLAGPLTLSQLGEALAMWSQTQQMVSTTIDRLVQMGFAARAAEDAPRPAPPTLETARRELTDAAEGLKRVAGSDPRPRGTIHERTADDGLRHAMSRFVAAHRFLTSLAEED